MPACRVPRARLDFGRWGWHNRRVANRPTDRPTERPTGVGPGSQGPAAIHTVYSAEASHTVTDNNNSNSKKVVEAPPAIIKSIVTVTFEVDSYVKWNGKDVPVNVYLTINQIFSSLSLPYHVSIKGIEVSK